MKNMEPYQMIKKLVEERDLALKQLESIGVGLGDNMDHVKTALEKQIPKNPNVHGYREGREINTISYTCPTCNKHISREKFCKNCGQAIDWGE